MKDNEYDYPLNVIVDFSDPELTQAEIEKLTADKELPEKWANAISQPAFNERFKAMVEMFYRDGLSLNEIGRRFGVTGERVRQILKRDLVRNINNNKNNVRSLFMDNTEEYDMKRKEGRKKYFREHATGAGQPKSEETDELSRHTILELDPDPKLTGILSGANIKTLRDLKECDPVAFAKSHYMDRRTLRKFVELMEKMGVEVNKEYFGKERGLDKPKGKKNSGMFFD